MTSPLPPGAHDPRTRTLAGTSRGWELRAPSTDDARGARALRQVQLWHPTRFASVLVPSRVVLGLPLAFEDVDWLIVTLDRSLLADVLRGTFGVELPGRATIRALCRWHLGPEAERSRSFELGLRAAELQHTASHDARTHR